MVVEERDGNEVEKRRNGTENEKKRDSTKSSPPDSLPMSTTTEADGVSEAVRQLKPPGLKATRKEREKIGEQTGERRKQSSTSRGSRIRRSRRRPSGTF